MDKVTIHPKTCMAAAAIDAYERGCHLSTRYLGLVSLVQGRDPVQYAKALKAQSLQRLAAVMRQG